MLSVVPVLILLSVVAVLLALGRWKLRAGSAWLLAAASAFAAWILMIPIGILNSSPVSVGNWLPRPYPFDGIVFQFTGQTWVLGFLAATLLTAIIFSEAQHLETEGYLGRLSAELFFAAITLLAVMARSGLAFILTWSLIDIFELVTLVTLIKTSENHQTAAVSILFRTLGTLLFVIVLSSASNQTSQAGSMGNLWWLILFACLFRLAIFPLYPHYTENPVLQRGILTLLRFIPLLTVFSFIDYSLGGFGSLTVPQIIMPLLTIGLLYGSVAWFLAKDELKGRPYWIFTSGILGVLALLSNTPFALTGLGIFAVAIGGALFLYTRRLKKINPILMILVLSALLLPFTPTASLPALFSPGKYSFLQVFWLIGYAILLAGFVKHALHRDQEEEPKEPWMILFHRISLYFIAVVPWSIVVLRKTEILIPTNWWVAIGVIFITGLVLAAYLILPRRTAALISRFSWLSQLLNTAYKALDTLFRFAWLGKLTGSLGFVIEKGVSMLVRMLEGSGGMLWSFLFLVLLFSLLLARQVP